MKRIISVITSVIICVCLCLPVAHADKLSEGEGLIRVACVGDSITQGTGTSYEGAYAWPTLLQTLLDSKKYDVRNFGVSGTTAMESSSSSYRKTDLYIQSLEFQPNIVIIMLGTNDVYSGNYTTFKTKFDEEYISLVQTYRNLESHPTIYMCTSPYAEEEDPTRSNRITEELVPKQIKLAETLNCTLVDVYNFSKSLAMSECYHSDKLHPNNEGNRQFARFFAEQIFHYGTATVTLTLPQGAKAYLHGESDTTFTVGEGTSNFIIVQNNTYRIASITAKTGDDIMLDCTDISSLTNIAFDGIPIDVGDAGYNSNRLPATSFDGNITTGWQLDGKSHQDGKNLSMWLGVQFDFARNISGITIVWELGSRCATDGYTVEYSNDGTTWNRCTGLVRALDGACPNTTNTSVDCIAFDTVSANHIRVMCNYAGNHKSYTPQIFELECYETSPVAFTYEHNEETQNKTDSKPDQTMGGNGLPVWGYVAISICIILAITFAIFGAIKRNKG